jgi:hypothetical protein
MNFCSNPIRTNSQFLEYMETVYVFHMPANFRPPNLFSSYFPNITDEQLQALAVAYPDDITQVSDHIVKSVHA